ncbi:hypothetical protein OS493_005564 [Desmophyllum pertusum]|uniref:Uncharacterized protein n=1 Tax=Desmophyllum pertusum TaxID=174260 RepID=A0A9X0CMK6_9CNID|nr:hypothetical protein OS493_005564 [Desmophyllum pertusum]
MSNIHHMYMRYALLKIPAVHKQTISSAQQPSCYSEVISTSQGTSSEADTSTFQGTSCPQQSDVHVVIDCQTHTTVPLPQPPDSVELSGLQIYKADCKLSNQRQ